ncbi:glutathione peroxidase [Methylobacillus gramineus]|uniref:glutathione peroxidase n=1 Tax=Methylobacillus gramineus TaxID=755169 RepID=UPI001CFFF0E4|nr:glutathione peroxidase [Methylobacillus gramineus]MCB5184200.1 glutathione peroxidase [Methylobacillus gramineus]
MKFLLLAVFGLVLSQQAMAACSGVYTHKINTLQGNKVDLCQYQNVPILVVNTASKCGFSPQFEKLEALSEQYKGKLLVLGFPSNDFQQELSTNKEIGDFCKQTYDVKFPMALKSSVVGADANPLYKKLKALTHEAPMWNFHKYLILPNAEEVYAYSSDVSPDAPTIMHHLKPYLK